MDYPHMKAKDRERLYKALQKQAFPDRIEEVMTTKDFARKHLNGQ